MGGSVEPCAGRGSGRRCTGRCGPVPVGTGPHSGQLSSSMVVRTLAMMSAGIGA